MPPRIVIADTAFLLIAIIGAALTWPTTAAWAFVVLACIEVIRIILYYRKD